MADNVIREGALADPESDDPKVLAQRQLHEAVAAEDRVGAGEALTLSDSGAIAVHQK